MALADYGIRVNAVGPGTIETKMSEAVTSDVEMRERVLARTPLGRLGRPEEIAAVAAVVVHRRPAEVLEPELEKAKAEIGDLAVDMDDIELGFVLSCFQLELSISSIDKKK